MHASSYLSALQPDNSCVLESLSIKYHIRNNLINLGFPCILFFITANCIIVDVLIFFSVCTFVCSKQPDIDKGRCGAPIAPPHFVSWLVVLITPCSPTSCGLVSSPCHFNICLVGPGVCWGAIQYDQQYKKAFNTKYYTWQWQHIHSTLIS